MTIKFHLSELDMDEVSFVSAGDNPPAKILLTKSLEDEETFPNVLEGEEIANVHLDDGNLYVSTAKNSIYMFPRANLSKSDDGGTTVAADDPILLVEDSEEGEDEEIAGDDPENIEKGLFDRFMKWWRSDEVDAVEKAKFADMMQSKMADQVYEEMYQLGMTLRAAIDDEMLSGTATSQSLKGSLHEFVQVIEDAIDNRWLNGKLVNKEVDAEVMEKVAERDAEVLGVVKTREGGAGVGEESRSDEPVNKSKGDEVAGIDRSKLSKEEVAYLDGVEQKVETLEGQVATLQGGGSGEGQSELEKSLAGLPEPVRKEFMAQRETIAKMEREADERTYISKVEPLTALAVNPTELGKALRRVEKGEAGSDEYNLILETLQSANEVVKMGGDILFDSIGKRRPNSDGSASAGVEVMEKARAIAQSEQVDMEVALGKVRNNPANADLVKRYDEEEAV